MIRPKKSSPAPRASPKVAPCPAAGHAPRLLAGGNPQIAKGEGDEVVRAYIDAMPEWKREVGLRLDAIITRAVPGVRKAVKWNSPLYGTEVNGWFLGIHCFAKYIKVAFFRGASLVPPPPVAAKDASTRYLHIGADGVLDEAQFVRWVKDASAREGWNGK